MTYFHHLILTAILFYSLTSCLGQNRSSDVSHKSENTESESVVGGPFENDYFMYIGMPEFINSIDTSPGWHQNGQKLLITGTILKLDGKTPAPDVMLYYYHTDIHGLYSDQAGLDPRVRQHGYIRGWVRSDEHGKYSIYTVRPESYPDRDIAAHIHPAVKEPTIEKEYYIDQFVFDDDKLLTTKQRREMENRGGSGILRVLEKGDLQIAEHDIILGLNIPNYPEKRDDDKLSGLPIGEDQPSFTPFHAWGPDKGTSTCPVCKYGRYHGIIYFVGDRPDWDEIKEWLNFLEQESVARKKYLKVYFVYGNENNYDRESRIELLENLGSELKIKDIALTFVPSFLDRESEVYRNKINADVQNTFVIYRHRNIIDKFINLQPTEQNFALVRDALDRTKSKFFDLDEPIYNRE